MSPEKGTSIPPCSPIVPQTEGPACPKIVCVSQGQHPLQPSPAQAGWLAGVTYIITARYTSCTLPIVCVRLPILI